MKNPRIATKLGIVKGKLSTDYLGGKYYSFQGIPYAKAPVGNLRFKPPQPPDAWSGELDATKVGPACPSMHIFYMKYFGNEDNCLNLNVYIKELPNCDTFPNPVMVWIHGGVFITGSNSTDLFNPEFLMTENVIQVIINYRLGVFGFLSLEDESLGVMGNAGLKDQVMALKWVKDNISTFGGDPNNVTIYGHSAGAASVHYLMISPKAKGLFHKAIIQSGSIFSPWAQGRRGAKEIMECLGIEEKDETKILDILQKMTSSTLAAAVAKLPELMLASQHRLFGPLIEKPSEEAFLTEHPMIALQSGNYNKVPLIIGATSNEAIFHKMFTELRKSKWFFDCQTEIPFELKVPPNSEKAEILVKKINQFYKLDEDFNDDNKWKLKSDNLFIHGIHRAVNHHLGSSNHPIYYYKFSFEGHLNYTKTFATTNFPITYFTCCYLSTIFNRGFIGNMFAKMAKNINNRKVSGSCHGDDLGYLFGSIISLNAPAESREEKTIQRMVKLWTNFAKYGNPTPEHPDDLGILWGPVDKQHHHYLEIGDELVMRTNPFEESNRFWDEIYEMCETESSINADLA